MALVRAGHVPALVREGHVPQRHSSQRDTSPPSSQERTRPRARHRRGRVPALVTGEGTSPRSSERDTSPRSSLRGVCSSASRIPRPRARRRRRRPPRRRLGRVPLGFIYEGALATELRLRALSAELKFTRQRPRLGRVPVVQRALGRPPATRGRKSASREHSLRRPSPAKRLGRRPSDPTRRAP